MGRLLLQGGAEFGGAMAESDREAIRLMGGRDARIRIIPAAAAPDGNPERAGRNGESWFRTLGVDDVAALPLIDRETAEAAEVAAEIRSAGIIYLLGGFPGHLAESLAGTAAWAAALAAYAAGAVIAGSSAGAMVLCDRFYDPHDKRVRTGLGMLPGVCILPHHGTFGRHWSDRVKTALPKSLIIGIDEETAILDDGDRRYWQVIGKGAVTLYAPEENLAFSAGDHFELKID